jgi:hypothetical protein
MYRACGEVVGAGRIKHAGNGFAVTERIAFRVVQLQKANLGSGQCSESQCMSYTALRPGGKEQRAYWRRRYERGGMTEDDVSVYTTKRKQESREGEEKRRTRKGREKKRKKSGRETYPRIGLKVINLGNAKVQGTHYLRGQPEFQVAPSTRRGFASAQTGAARVLEDPHRCPGARGMPMRDVKVTLQWEPTGTHALAHWDLGKK